MKICGWQSFAFPVQVGNNRNDHFRYLGPVLTPLHSCAEPNWWIKVARYSFSGPIPPKFEHKLRRHKRSFGNIATTVVLDEDENLLWSGLQRHRSFHSNEMTLLAILLAAVYLGTRNCSSKIIRESFFLQKQPRRSWSLSEICKSVIEIFWDKGFVVRNMVKIK